MAIYLLTWNPGIWQWDSLEEDIAALQTKGTFYGRWSCGRRKNIMPGDRVFLFRQGMEPRGIIASGWAATPVFEDEHWNLEKYGEQTANYIWIYFDALLNPDQQRILQRQYLLDQFAGVTWDTQTSGIVIPDSVAERLEEVWSDLLNHVGVKVQDVVLDTDDFSVLDTQDSEYHEGARRQITINIYERNLQARAACLRCYGTKCSVCEFDFAKTYGDRGAGYIHVHHLIPLSNIGRDYILNPVSDLRPICPNCHAMIHRGPDLLTIEELRNLVRRQGRLAGS